ncbi:MULTISPECIES: hypothetical protein [Exiguobacterium]|uniref:hypothetical protein n=1 Tax=Exiguobacterium TaxID=33986 RepID=UPI001AE8F8E7|nr:MULTISPECIES: hypothetical protein [Exiguobacterium]MCT4779860.1 hypothetical protein [Exiguobacterium soli]
MDMKRFEKITGKEAVERLINHQEVYDAESRRYFVLEKSTSVWVETEFKTHFSTGGTSLTLSDFLEKDWYVKKPFDVRVEMLARPDEWVAAFKDGDVWHKVGFNSKSMSAYETENWDYDFRNKELLNCIEKELDKCIPIEDVPEEELT